MPQVQPERRNIAIYMVDVIQVEDKVASKLTAFEMCAVSDLHWRWVVVLNKLETAFRISCSAYFSMLVP